MENRESRITATPGPRACALLHPLSSILLFALTFALNLGGCTTAGALAYKLSGPRPIRAQYKPVQQPMLVLVENYRNPSAAMLDAEQLSNRLADGLRFYQVAPVVNPSKLGAVQSAPAYAKMTIPAVGRATGAEQILYVNVRRFGIEQTVAGDMMKGAAEMTVRIVDAATGDNRWPADAAGHPVLIETPWQRQTAGTTESALRDQMSRSAATYIVKLFRKYSVEDERGG